MNKKLLAISILLSVSLLSFAQGFQPEFNLRGIPKLEYNEIDVYRFQKGFSITAYPHNKFGTYQIQTHKEIDYDKQLVKLTAKLNNLELYPPIFISLKSFNRNAFYGYFKRELLVKCKELLGNKEREQGEGLIPEIVIKLPKMALPKSVRRFMGDKAGRLNLNGSQRLTFAGRMFTRSDAVGEGDDNIDFTPEMRQDLNLRLRGTIGEKIHVDVNHQSTSDDEVMPTPSEININYEGDEDEIVRAVDGGNISLSLAGSKFISYSASSEGLFGIKTQFEAGHLRVTTIMGKDEAQKNTQTWKGSAEPRENEMRSSGFVNKTHYYIEQPSALYSLYGDADGVEGVAYPMGWKDNAIKLDPEFSNWELSPAGWYLLPDPDMRLTVYLDDGSASNNTMTRPGVNYIDPGETYHFDILTEGTDYIFNYDAGIITMMGAVNKIYAIGITYTRNDGTVIGNDASSPVETKMLRIENQEVSDEDYWDLQVRNFYNLGMQNIENEGFEMTVYTKPAGSTIPYPNAPEEVVTPSFPDITLNEYLRLDNNDDGKINGEDTAVNLIAGYIYFPFIKPFYSLNDSIIYYQEPVTDPITNYIFIKGKIGRENIQLQMGILPGSIVIKIGPDKRKLIENIDFIADYDFGLITFLTSEAKDPEIEIIIDYQFKPLFAMDNKTILGLRADMEFNENIKLGGTFIYQSEKVREDRPKIGNENRSIILADIDGEIDYELPFITKFIDWLPLIKTDARSSVTLSGEVAMSLPRIYGSDKQYDKKEAYLDDMESTIEMYPLGITRATWSFASRPAEEPMGNLIDYGKAHINYYNPNDVYARDVYDPNSLTEKEEKEKVSVLACKIKPPDIGMPGTNMKYWAGVMKYIGNEVDFSNKKYIEILAKVDTLNYNQESRPVVMHIDLGKVSEDFYRPGENDLPDKEDGGPETPVDGFLDGGEDIGLDRIKTGDSGDDPDDNFDNEEVVINGAEEYPYINGTEGNNKLDTEDLNDNYDLDKDNIYFEYSVSLNDGEEFMEGEFNGWRLFRIPLHNPENYRIITDNASKIPNIKKISFSRIWFEVEDSTRVRIVNLDIVGNKWEEGFIKNEDGTVATGNTEIMQVGIADNQSGHHYTPAPHTVIEENGEATLEQSLTIDYNDLGTRKHGLVTQEFFDPYNLLSYNKIRYWVYAEKPITGYSPEEQDSLIIRLGADSVNYYEIKQPLYLQEYNAIMDEDGWREIEIEFSEFTQLKNLDSNNDVSYYIGDIKLSKVGNPSLSDVREMSLGLEASNQFTGRIYFDDIRVADPYEDLGIATRANFSTSFADFATFNIGLDYRSENFQSSARRTTNVSYVQQTSLDITNRINLNKFMPAEWGFNIPLNLARTQSVGIPRFKSGSDILREDLLAEDKDRETNRNLSYRADLTISQSKTPKSKILAYTLKNTTISGNIQKTFTTNATRADTTTTYTLKHIYNFTIPKEKIDIGLFSNYKFHFFPHNISNTLTLRNTDPYAWLWDTYTDSIPHWAPNTNSFQTRTFETSSGFDYDILSDISTSYDLTTKRDLMLKNYWKGYNIGEEKERTQNITVGFDPKYIDNIFSFNADASVTYDDDHVKSGTQDTLYYRGGVNRKIGGNITLKNQDILRDLASWLDNKFSGTVEGKEESESDQKIEEIKEEEKDSFKQPEMRTPFGSEEPKDKLEEPEKRGEGELKEGEELEGSSPEEPGKGGEEGQQEPEKKPEQPTMPERKSNLFASIVSYISGLSNISISYDNIYRTTYDDRFDRPDFLYQLGLPHILDEEGDDKEIILKTITDKYSTSASFPIIRNLSSNFGYSREITTTLSNISKLKITTTFPNVSVTLTEFEKLIHAEKILTSSRLTSSYVYSEMLDGDIGFTQADTEQNRINLTPLISWHGNWIHNITSSFSLNYSDLKNISHRVNYDDIRHTTSRSMNGNLSWSFSNPKGIRILFFKRTNMKNEITTDVNFNMTMDKTKSKGQEIEITEIDKTLYRITPGASYKFSKSITAGLTSEYEWTEDKKRVTTSSMFRLSIWIEIIF